MTDKELYQKKKQAQLDEWKAELAKLRAKAAGANADAQLEMNKQIKSIEGKIEDGKGKLVELAEASEEAWDSIRDGVESAWDCLKFAVGEAASKFKK